MLMICSIMHGCGFYLDLKERRIWYIISVFVEERRDDGILCI